MFDEMLLKFGLKYSDLSPEEIETMDGWINNLQQGQLTLEKVREYVTSMRSGVEQELTKVGHECKQDIFLKARLRNLLLIEACLISPEKAKEQMERAIAGIASKRG